MRRLTLALVSIVSLGAAPAFADLDAALDDHVLPNVARFAQATQALAETSAGTCAVSEVQPAYHAAFDAWMGLSHLNFGPVEDQGRYLAISFWPDTRGMGSRNLARLIADQDPVVEDPAHFAEESVAARGLFALEMLLFDPQFVAETEYHCALTRAVTRDLARMGAEIEADWQPYAALMRSAGAPENGRFLSEREPLLTLYTALMTGIEMNKDQRLGRPLGTLDRPRPTRAEARRSGRSLRNVMLSLEALEDLAGALQDDPIPQVQDAMASARRAAEAIETADFSDVDDLGARFKVEILQQRVSHLRDMVEADVGGPMDLSSGFNASDGD